MERTGLESLNFLTMTVLGTVHTAQVTVLQSKNKLEWGPMPNVMDALPNTGGTLCSTLQSLADAHY